MRRALRPALGRSPNLRSSILVRLSTKIVYIRHMRSRESSWRLWAVPALIVALGAGGCVERIRRKVSSELKTVDQKAAFLKVHMRNGDVYVLRRWRVNAATLSGFGQHQGVDRRTSPEQAYELPMDDIALFETNVVETSPALAALAVIGTVSVVVSVACLTNPKSCFGSCPTFYAPDDKTGAPVLQAEGFSDAIAPSLESSDVDALYRSSSTGGAFTIRMTNEAYETHVVKHADLLAVPRPPGGRVLARGDELWAASQIVAPSACRAEDGDCLASLRTFDGEARLSLTDPSDLGAREHLELEFRGLAPGRHGIVISARQSLVTTFLLYQGLAFLGDTVGTWLAAIERGDAAARTGGRGWQAALGGIEVQVPDGDGWRTVDEFYETGPIATDVHMLLLPEGESAERVRLRLARGNWRVDHVAVATLIGRVEPIRVPPHSITGTLGAEFAAGRTPATGFPIVTQPGDAYLFTYQLPSDRGPLELFLDSRGYYLEWMRKEWVAEQAPLRGIRMVLDPESALRRYAPAYKRVEHDIERMFWGSRYARP